jgi:hypothetical protein
MSDYPDDIDHVESELIDSEFDSDLSDSPLNEAELEAALRDDDYDDFDDDDIDNSQDSQDEEEDDEDEDEDEDEEEEDEEEEEEEEEPKLKYQRVGADLPQLLEHDTVRCLTAHEKFLVCHVILVLLIFYMVFAPVCILYSFSRRFPLFPCSLSSPLLSSPLLSSPLLSPPLLSSQLPMKLFSDR